MLSLYVYEYALDKTTLQRSFEKAPYDCQPLQFQSQFSCGRFDMLKGYSHVGVKINMF
jgi:hypothetical protein